MGQSRTVYAGCYLRVWMPREQYEASEKKCSRCGRSGYGNFCAHDGAPMEPIFQDVMRSFCDFCENVFGNVDQFARMFFEGGGDEYWIVLANLKTQPGHVYLNSDARVSEHKMPQEDWSGDWVVLVDALERAGIRFEKRFGVVDGWE